MSQDNEAREQQHRDARLERMRNDIKRVQAELRDRQARERLTFAEQLDRLPPTLAPGPEDEIA